MRSGKSEGLAMQARTYLSKGFQCRLAIVGLFIAAPCAAPVFAQDAAAPGKAATPMVERAAKGLTAKPIRVGVYLNARPDCTSGSLPGLRLVSPPTNGVITIKRGKVTATNYRQCLALEVPGFVAFYQSKPNFVGADIAIIEVKYPQGRTELQRITIEVSAAIDGQKI
jgi:hypothetical protein